MLMKMKSAALLIFLASSSVMEVQAVSPIQKVIEMLSGLEAKIMKAGEEEQKAYEDFVSWCEDAAKNKGFELKTAKANKMKQEATIAKCKSDAEAADTAIAEKVATIAQNEADLKDATDIREKEHAEFTAAETELVETVDTLERAIGVIEKSMKGSALLQTPATLNNIQGLIKTLNVVMEAASFSSQDQKSLISLVQSKQNSDDDEEDDAFGAPAPDAYKSKSGGIVDVLEDMREKAEGELSEARKAESNAQHNYDMLKQGITDEIAAATHEKGEAESAKTEAEGTKATTEGDLEVTTKVIAEAEAALGVVSTDCMTTASDHEVSVNGRTAELKALATAKKLIQSSTSFQQASSFFQISSASSSSSGSNLRTSSDLKNFEVVNVVKRLATQQHSAALSQLASRIQAAIRYGAASNEDPFAKVKQLITEMIDKLIKEGEAEAGMKAYCDNEMAKTKAKKEELKADIDKLSYKIDVASSRSVTLKAEVKELQKELAELVESQAEMDKVRKEQNDAFVEAKADLEKGLDGVGNALKVLRDFYESDASLMQDNSKGDLGDKFQAFMQQPAQPVTHSKSSGAGGGIIDMLEVIESDFSKNLAQIEEEEAAAVTDYEKITQENKVTKTTKEQDVKYKTKEFTGLDKDVAELTSDRDSTSTELDAVMDYDTKIKDQCIAKPMPYEERKKRREAEIAGLKEALSILEGQAFLQKRSIFAHKLH